MFALLEATDIYTSLSDLVDVERQIEEFSTWRDKFNEAFISKGSL
jgi:hypothetical protein